MRLVDMPIYKYIAKGKDGATIKGTIEAEDEKEVVRRLKGDSIFPIEIIRENSMNRELKFSIPKKVKIKDLFVFCKQFHAILEAGIPLLESLEILGAQSENKRLKYAIYEVYEDVQKGNSLSSAMKKQCNIFPDILTSMVESGEVSGQLDTVMERLAIHFEKENKLKQKITSSMVYPAIIGILSIFVVWFLMAFVLPNFISMFGSYGLELPWITRMLLRLGSFLG